MNHLKISIIQINVQAKLKILKKIVNITYDQTKIKIVLFKYKKDAHLNILLDEPLIFLECLCLSQG